LGAHTKPILLVGAGCKPLPAATLEDKFKSRDPGWAVAPAAPIFFADGAMILRLPRTQTGGNYIRRWSSRMRRFAR
jgi:hypothetical protein